MLAIHRAAALDAAPWLSANTLAPLACGVKNASACKLMNKSACTFWAFCTRTCKGKKKSASRVKKARKGNSPRLVFNTVLLMRSCKSWAICSTTSFSRVPLGPIAPGSSPPCPGSIATTANRSVLSAGFSFADGATTDGTTTGGTTTGGTEGVGLTEGGVGENPVGGFGWLAIISPKASLPSVGLSPIKRSAIKASKGSASWLG